MAFGPFEHNELQGGAGAPEQGGYRETKAIFVRLYIQSVLFVILAIRQIPPKSIHEVTE